MYHSADQATSTDTATVLISTCVQACAAWSSKQHQHMSTIPPSWGNKTHARAALPASSHCLGHHNPFQPLPFHLCTQQKPTHNTVPALTSICAAALAARLASSFWLIWLASWCSRSYTLAFSGRLRRAIICTQSDRSRFYKDNALQTWSRRLATPDCLRRDPVGKVAQCVIAALLLQSTILAQAAMLVPQACVGFLSCPTKQAVGRLSPHTPKGVCPTSKCCVTQGLKVGVPCYSKVLD